MKLYKFRPLGSCDQLCRIKKIIETGEFWCSKFAEMNDPMEGVYYTISTNQATEIFDEKNRYKICSFSAKEGFENPAMWGYYANGFKGLAIEIEIDKNEVMEINYIYQSKLQKLTSVKKILTTKLEEWIHEKEYRFLKETDKNKNKIGQITKVFIGNPYGDVINKKEIIQNNKQLSRLQIPPS